MGPLEAAGDHCRCHGARGPGAGRPPPRGLDEVAAAACPAVTSEQSGEAPHPGDTGFSRSQSPVSAMPAGGGKPWLRGSLCRGPGGRSTPEERGARHRSPSETHRPPSKNDDSGEVKARASGAPGGLRAQELPETRAGARSRPGHSCSRHHAGSSPHPTPTLVSVAGQGLVALPLASVQ